MSSPTLPGARPDLSTPAAPLRWRPTYGLARRHRANGTMAGLAQLIDCPNLFPYARFWDCGADPSTAEAIWDGTWYHSKVRTDGNGQGLR